MEVLRFMQWCGEDSVFLGYNVSLGDGIVMFLRQCPDQITHRYFIIPRKTESSSCNWILHAQIIQKSQTSSVVAALTSAVEESSFKVVCHITLFMHLSCQY